MKALSGSLPIYEIDRLPECFNIENIAPYYGSN